MNSKDKELLHAVTIWKYQTIQDLDKKIDDLNKQIEIKREIITGVVNSIGYLTSKKEELEKIDIRNVTHYIYDINKQHGCEEIYNTKKIKIAFVLNIYQ